LHGEEPDRGQGFQIGLCGKN